jgi:hypothetical protein
LGPGRLHALIDGVFAIALTLLVLDLPKPAHSTQLVHDLLHQWPSYVAYLVSFVTIGLLWIEHHGMMSAVRFINRRFLERTLVFLLFISIIPWPTALASNYADQGVPQARAAAVLYAATMLMMGLSSAASPRAGLLPVRSGSDRCPTACGRTVVPIAGPRMTYLAVTGHLRPGWTMLLAARNGIANAARWPPRSRIIPLA